MIQFKNTMKEKFYCWLAWRLPRELVKWCAVRVFAEGTFVHRELTASELTAMQALEAWND